MGTAGCGRPLYEEDIQRTRKRRRCCLGVERFRELRQRKDVDRGTEPLKTIMIKVDFVKPFEAHNVNEFTLDPVGASTLVTWRMHGTNAYFMKLMGVFVNMDKMMGKHFERGLDNLKIVCEKQTGNLGQRM